MFIQQSQNGYTRGGEQFARGRFLILFCHNLYEWKRINIGQVFTPSLHRKLYACVRHVSLRQMGHWMMGSVNIAGQRITVSGSYGADGLPMQYEILEPAARDMVVEVPANIANLYWNDDDRIGTIASRQALKAWAEETFSRRPGVTSPSLGKHGVRSGGHGPLPALAHRR